MYLRGPLGSAPKPLQSNCAVETAPTGQSQTESLDFEAFQIPGVHFRVKL